MSTHQYQPRDAPQYRGVGQNHESDFVCAPDQLRAQVWDTLQPVNEAVLRGEAQWSRTLPFALGQREGPAISYFSFSCTPLQDDTGSVSGLFCAATETTRAVLQRQELKQQAAPAPLVRTGSRFTTSSTTVGKEDGVIRWVAAKGRGVFDESGCCVRVAGTAIDIRARKQADAALSEASSAVHLMSCPERTSSTTQPAAPTLAGASN